VETDRATEFAVLRALESTPVPAPAARWLDAEGKWFGRPSLVMHREVGACEYYVLSGSRPLEERVGLAQQFCDLLAQVHRADWKRTELVDVFDDKGEGAALAELVHWEGILRRDQLEAYPEIEMAIQWMRATAPLSEATVLVHGDFKPGNVLLEEGRIVALLDWELAHLGDPMEDLGWVTQPLRRREHIIPGAWEDSELFDRYQSATGFSVHEPSVRWWNVFATFRTAVMQVSGLRSFLEARSDEFYRPTARVLRALLECVDA
jgi:aminoglycoside phosphotransferase (APT) family kinase protein